MIVPLLAVAASAVVWWLVYRDLVRHPLDAMALVLYYLALGRTPASRATLAELAFPVTAALVGVLAFATRPEPTQWMGIAIVLASVVGLAMHEQRAARPAVRAGLVAQAAPSRR